MEHCTNVWKGEVPAGTHQPQTLTASAQGKLSVAMESPRQIGESSSTYGYTSWNMWLLESSPGQRSRGLQGQCSVQNNGSPKMMSMS